MLRPSVQRQRSVATRRTQRGVVAIEFALVFLFGVLPLLFLTFTGIMVFSAKQALTLSAAEGARSALRYSLDASSRNANICATAKASMQWLLDFSGDNSPCGGAIAITGPFACAGGASCIKVVTSYDYDTHPFLPAMSWVFGHKLTSSATVQLDASLTGTL